MRDEKEERKNERVALPCCLFDLACFLLLSFYMYLINVYMYMYM